MERKNLIDSGNAHLENLFEVFFRVIFLTREGLDKIDGARQKSNDVRMYEKSENMVVYFILMFWSMRKNGMSTRENKTTARLYKAKK